MLKFGFNQQSERDFVAQRLQSCNALLRKTPDAATSVSYHSYAESMPGKAVGFGPV